MRVRLVRHAFPDNPNWIIVKESVPLGTEYEVVGYQEQMIMRDQITGQVAILDCYKVSGRGHIGYIPAIVFEEVRDEHNQKNTIMARSSKSEQKV